MCAYIITPDRWQSKQLILSTNVDQKSLETEFLIAICHSTGDKCQSKTMFLVKFDPHSSIVKSIFKCCLSGVYIVCSYQVGIDMVVVPKSQYTLYSKTCVKQLLSKRPQIGFQDQLSLNAGQKYSAILPTFIQLQFVIKIFVLSIFEWPFYTGLTVHSQYSDRLSI